MAIYRAEMVGKGSGVRLTSRVLVNGRWYVNVRVAAREKTAVKDSVVVLANAVQNSREQGSRSRTGRTSRKQAKKGTS